MVGTANIQAPILWPGTVTAVSLELSDNLKMFVLNLQLKTLMKSILFVDNVLKIDSAFGKLKTMFYISIGRALPYFIVCL